MQHKQPLKNRIVIAFFLMTLVVAGVSSIGIFFIVHALEDHFISQGLSDNLQEILNSKMSQNKIMGLSLNTDFYTTNPQVDYPIPSQFKGAKLGFSEILLRNGRAYYIYKKSIDNQDYLIVKDQTDFEKREQILLCVVFFGFVVSLVFAYILGRLLANRILAPVIKLAKQVSEISLSQDKQITIRFDKQYADDEIGQLAVVFASAFSDLHNALERERLFTSDVSHELRTFLMVITTGCELLLLDKEKLSNKQYQQIQRINTANQDMHELVQTFLMLARKENSQIVGDRITLLSLAENQQAIWLPKFQEKNIQFSLEIKASNDKTYNKTLLKTVMSNLLRNAWHYTEEGIVKLVIDSDTFWVEDTGIGVPVEKQQAIFQAFVRGSSRGEGLGLGLSLVKRICTHEHWQVNLSSGETSGSVFSVRLNND